jgi:hypothetical protein
VFLAAAVAATASASMHVSCAHEPDEQKNSHETVISALTPFLTPVLAVQDLSFIKSCSGIKYAAFSLGRLFYFCAA